MELGCRILYSLWPKRVNLAGRGLVLLASCSMVLNVSLCLKGWFPPTKSMNSTQNVKRLTAVMGLDGCLECLQRIQLLNCVKRTWHHAWRHASKLKCEDRPQGGQVVQTMQESNDQKSDEGRTTTTGLVTEEHEEFPFETLAPIRATCPVRIGTCGTT